MFLRVATKCYHPVHVYYKGCTISTLYLFRFYLGYPAIGLLKLCTFGLCGIGALADFVLIALQVISRNMTNFCAPLLEGYCYDHICVRLLHLIILGISQGSSPLLVCGLMLCW